MAGGGRRVSQVACGRAAAFHDASRRGWANKPAWQGIGPPIAGFAGVSRGGDPIKVSNWRESEHLAGVEDALRVEDLLDLPLELKLVVAEFLAEPALLED